MQNVAAKPISWRAEHWVLGGVALLLTALVGIVIPGWANATRKPISWRAEHGCSAVSLRS